MPSPVFLSTSLEFEEFKNKTESGRTGATNTEAASNIQIENCLYYFFTIFETVDNSAKYVCIWTESANTPVTFTNVNFNHLNSSDIEGVCIYSVFTTPAQNAPSATPLFQMEQCTFNSITAYNTAKISGMGMCVRWTTETIKTEPTFKVLFKGLLFKSCLHRLSPPEDKNPYIPMFTIAGPAQNFDVQHINTTRMQLFTGDYSPKQRPYAGSYGFGILVNPKDGETAYGFTATMKYLQYIDICQLFGSIFVSQSNGIAILGNKFSSETIPTIQSCNFINASYGDEGPNNGGVIGTSIFSLTPDAPNFWITLKLCYFAKKTQFFGGIKSNQTNSLKVTFEDCKMDAFLNTFTKGNFNISSQSYLLFILDPNNQQTIPSGKEYKPVDQNGDGQNLQLTVALPTNKGPEFTHPFSPSNLLPEVLTGDYSPFDDKNNVAGVLAVIFGGFSLLYFLFTLYTRKMAHNRFHEVGEFVPFYSIIQQRNVGGAEVVEDEMEQCDSYSCDSKRSYSYSKRKHSYSYSGRGSQKGGKQYSDYDYDYSGGKAAKKAKKNKGKAKKGKKGKKAKEDSYSYSKSKSVSAYSYSESN